MLSNAAKARKIFAEKNKRREAQFFCWFFVQRFLIFFLWMSFRFVCTILYIDLWWPVISQICVCLCISFISFLLTLFHSFWIPFSMIYRCMFSIPFHVRNVSVLKNMFRSFDNEIVCIWFIRFASFPIFALYTSYNVCLKFIHRGN